MRIMIETTKWSVPTPNHVYVFDDGLTNIIAYVPEGSKKLTKFKTPMSIDRKGRTFKDLK